MTAPAFAHTSGPINAKLVLVGEAWGEQEALVQRPFIGYSGQELTRMLDEVGIARADCLLTNVLALQPPGNKIEALCGKKGDMGEGYALPPIQQGKYLRPEFLPELSRLREELLAVKPNLTVALGNVACWALLGSAGIGTLRGTITESTLCPGLKVLPTYHPAAVLRNWAWRPIVLADLLKAKREAEFPEIRRLRREALINPTLDEIHAWIVREAHNAAALAVDIETARGQIDMIGFAASPTKLMSIPFFNTGTFANYWPSVADEVAARQAVQQLLTLPCPKIFQNGLYDMQYLLREGFTLRNVAEDTMLMHHALYPEMPKGLGFLGSIYCNEASWKLLNRRRSDEVVKKDD